MTNALKETIILTASYYGRTLSPQVLAMYVEDLEDFPPADVIAAYKAWRRNPKNTQFPLPAQIRGIIQPEVDPDSAAREIASRIVGAISKCGWSNPTGAREYMGEVGWEIVRRFGGWTYVCENHGVSLQPAAFMAQARDLARAQLQFPEAAMAKAIGVVSFDKLAIDGKVDPALADRKEHAQYLAKLGIVQD